MNRIVTINAGGKLFQTYHSTLTRYPSTKFAQLFHQSSQSENKTPLEQEQVFLDVHPKVFESVLGFLRSGGPLRLPTGDPQLRASLLAQLEQWELLSAAFPSTQEEGKGAEEEGSVLPDVCVVQLCDHLQHDQGVKRHAMTITYGSDGFHLRELTRRIRHDLNGQLSSTFWQCYQTGERAAFFTTTKVANGAADILTTSITQQVITHTEGMGYHLVSSYVTLSPDVVHTSVRMLIHNFIFRRVQLGTLEMGDAEQLMQHGGGEEEELETFVNFEERPVGPQKHLAQPTTPAEGTRSSSIW